MTIQIPAFNAANDQLFLAIKNYFDIRFNELTDHIQQIKSKSDQLIVGVKKIETDINSLKFHKYHSDGNGKTGKFKLNYAANMKYKRSMPKSAMPKRKHVDTEIGTNKDEIIPVMKKECSEHVMENSEMFETNSFLIGINKTEVEIENKSDHEISQKNCELAFDNIIEKYLKVNESKLAFKDILEPVVVLNPLEKKEIFIGGNENVRLPLWAYKKCLTCIRGKPNELNSRLCLRLLQAKFGRKYMLTHNYNGSGDKVPIDRQIMSSILVQAKMQFPDQEDFQNNPAKFAMFRDYINNAFRVVAYRHRKGIQSNTPFWDQNGEPITDLDPPSWIVDPIN